MSRVEIDARTEELLGNSNSFYVQQQIQWLDAVSQGCISQKNKYHVFDKDTNVLIMIIKEESGDCNRCCCNPCHSLFAKFYLVDEAGKATGTPVLTLERDGCDCGQPSPKPCLCCFACTENCSDRGIIYAGDFGEAAVPGMSAVRDKSTMIGETRQPLKGGGFHPVLQIMERDESDPEPSNIQFAAARGPRCFGGMSELCCNVEFGASKAKPDMGVDEIHKLEFDYASITKVKPASFTQALREAFTDVDIYVVAFEEEDVTPQQKANFLGTMIMMEYMFFERSNDICRYDGRYFHLTFFNCFCYGCVCPCKLVFDTQAGN